MNIVSLVYRFARAAAWLCAGSLAARGRPLPLACRVRNRVMTKIVGHRVEATCLNEPQLNAAIAAGQVRILAPSYSAISDHFAFTVFFA